ncbi:MAG: DNA methyltransferase [Candidatus Nanohaloarchaea archaeon]
MPQQNLADREDFKFYEKNSKREIVAVTSEEKNKEAEKKLEKIKEERWDELPKRYRENWDEVALYHTKGDVDKAHALLLDPEEGAYDLKNKLNHMTGKEWTKFTKSWFIFDAKAEDLKEEREVLDNSEDHPATYSPTMIEDFVRFFTKEGEKVYDPFTGIGSTLVACKRNNREGYGTELVEKYYKDSLKRVPEFEDNVYNEDARKAKELFDDEMFQLSISSPPYWDMLNRSTKDFEDKRKERDLDTKYSDSKVDLGNIEDYNDFLDEITSLYLDIYDLLKEGGYLVIIVKNVNKNGEMHPLAWDLAKNLSEKYTLKDEKIWCQDEVGLAPYGYPYSWASNTIHHYCLILKKE